MILNIIFTLCRTKLDRNDTTGFREREERAERLAREIETSNDKHGVDDLGTEEEL